MLRLLPNGGDSWNAQSATLGDLFMAARHVANRILAGTATAVRALGADKIAVPMTRGGTLARLP